MCTIVKNSILEDVLVKYKTGMCLKDIAADYGISDTKVKKLLITAGVPIDNETYEIVTTLRQHGFSIAEIAQKANISYSTVSVYIPYSKGIYGLANVSRKVAKRRERVARHG